VSTLRSWLDGRTPPPPPEVAEGLRSGGWTDAPGGAGSADAVTERLLEAARSRLAKARTRPGRVRESAFDLLAGDAWVTYACEAALDSDDPDAALARILRETVGS